MAGQREEVYSLKSATVPYCYAHPDIQLLLINNYSYTSSKLLALSTPSTDNATKLNCYQLNILLAVTLSQ
eukprot:scaffold123153_cov66-Phaeocystis_antarctica.AAC.3